MVEYKFNPFSSSDGCIEAGIEHEEHRDLLSGQRVSGYPNTGYLGQVHLLEM